MRLGERQPNLALWHLIEALRIDPNYWKARYYLGIALVQVGRRDEALKTLERALRDAPAANRTKIRQFLDKVKKK